MRRLRLLQLQLLPITGLALLWAALAAAAQDDSGTLEVLVEDTSGPRSPDGTPALTFQERAAPTFLETDLGPGRSFTEAGEQIGTGAGRLITPTVTKLELPTEASDYPEVFYDLTKDGRDRVWVHDDWAPFVFTEGSSWRRVTHVLGSHVKDLGRDAQGDIWVVGSRAVWHIRGDSLTVYDEFGDQTDLYSFAAGSVGTVWIGGVGLPEHYNTSILLRFDGSQWRQFGPADGLPGYSAARALAVDSTGTVWAGLDDTHYEWDPPAAGPLPPLISYDGNEWRGYSFDTLVDPEFKFHGMRLLVDPGGTLWIQSGGRLMYKTGSGWVERKNGPWGILMAAEAADRVWLFGYDQIGVFEKGGRWRYFLNDGSDVFYLIRGLYYEDGGVLWMGSRRLGRWRLPGQATSVKEKMGQGQSYRPHPLESYPNPFNARTTIGFEIERSQPLSLRIHNTTGQLVTTLAQGVYPEGVFAVTWDGRDARGREVASGVYLCQLRLAGQVQAHSLTLVR